jgi:hypothetical protein
MKRALSLLFCLCSTGVAQAGDFIFFHSFENTTRPVPGSVIVTEIMSKPTAVSDNFGEWIELANLGAQSLDIDGCVVSNGSVQNPLPAFLLMPGGFAVMARNLEASMNGNVVAFASFTFGLTASGTIILSCDGRVIDQTSWVSNELAGSSRSLDPNHFDETQNNNPVNWCFATTLYNAVDKGTPGFNNSVCPP